MASPSSSQPPRSPDLWEHLETLLSDLEREVRGNRSTNDSIASVLAAAVHGIGCRAAWLALPPTELSIVAPLATEPTTLTSAAETAAETWEQLRQGSLLVRAEVGLADRNSLQRSSLSRWQPEPRGGSWSAASWTIPATDSTAQASERCELLWRPVGVELGIHGWLGISIAPGSDSTREAIGEIAWVLAGLIAERLQHERTSALERKVSDGQAFRQWLSRLAELNSSSLLRSATQFASRLTGAERVWLASVNSSATVSAASHRRVKLLAVSDCEQWDSRSEWVRQLIKVLSESNSDNTQLPDSTNTLGLLTRDSQLLPNIEVWRWNDQGNSPWIWIFETAEVISVERINESCEHLLAVRTIVESELTKRKSLFTRTLESCSSLWNGSSRTYRQIVAAVIFLLVLLLGLVPVPLRIVVQGELQPVVQRRLFAPEDGTVQLNFKDGQQVASGESLLTLVNDGLLQTQAKLEGELRTSQAERESLESRLASINILDSASALEAERLRVRTSVLERQQQGLMQELEVLQRRVQSLDLLSPIAGQVIAPDAERVLSDRPVQRGQSLLVVADRQGEWEVHAQINPVDAGPIAQQLRRISNTESAMAIEVRSSVEPSRVWQGTQPRLIGRALFDPQGTATLPFQAKIGDQIPETLLPGSRVTLKIDCGNRPLAAVLFRRLFDWGRENGWL